MLHQLVPALRLASDMTPKELKALASYMDVLRVRDSLHLTDRQRAVFNLVYIHGLSLSQVYWRFQTDKDLQQFACSESTVAHESAAIRRMLRYLGDPLKPP